MSRKIDHVVEETKAILQHEVDQAESWWKTGYNKWYVIGGVAAVIGVVGYIVGS